MTAQRREQRLQDVPISVSAFSEKTLQAQAITDTLDLAKLSPALVVNKTLTAANPWIRGVGTQASGFGTELPSAVYLDGFVLPTPGAGVFTLNNIERIEVLKGPQGTLFGRNAVAGVVQVITKTPSQTPTLDASVGYGNYDTVSGSFFASGGVARDLAGSVGFTGSRQGEGWGTNVFTGDDAFKTEQFSVTSKLRWEPSDRTTVTLSGLYDDRLTDVGMKYGITPGAFGTDGTPFLGRYTVSNRRDEQAKTILSHLGLTIEQDLGFATLVSLTGSAQVHSKFTLNLSGQPGSFAPPRAATEADADARSDSVTQEFQLLSPDDSPVKWILGAFYLKDDTRQYQVVHGICAGAAASTCIGAPPILIVARQDSRSYAAFGQAEVSLSERLNLTLGLRYTKDKKSIADSFAAPAPGYPNTLAALPSSQAPRPGVAVPGSPAIDPSEEWSKITWRLALDYKFRPGVMGYASYNRGFKGGTYNFTSFNNPAARPEVLDAYEVGVKSTLFNQTVRANVAAYYYDYQDIQLRTLAPPAPPGFAILYNAAKSSVKGVDIDLQYAPTENLILNGALTLLDAKYDKFPGGNCSRPAVRTATVLGGNVPQPCDLSGKQMIRAPKVGGTLGFIYTIPVEFGRVEIAAADTYTSKYYFEAANRLSQPAFHSVSASLRWIDPSGRYNIQLWGKNLLDEFVYAVAFEASTDNYAPADPRTFGIRFGVHF